MIRATLVACVCYVQGAMVQQQRRQLRQAAYMHTQGCCDDACPCSGYVWLFELHNACKPCYPLVNIADNSVNCCSCILHNCRSNRPGKRCWGDQAAGEGQQCRDSACVNHHHGLDAAMKVAFVLYCEDPLDPSISQSLEDPTEFTWEENKHEARHQVDYVNALKRKVSTWLEGLWQPLCSFQCIHHVDVSAIACCLRTLQLLYSLPVMMLLIVCFVRALHRWTCHHTSCGVLARTRVMC